MYPREAEPFHFDFVLYGLDRMYLWERNWYPITGVPDIDLTMDLRNVVLGTRAVVKAKPALQTAATRVDRPDPGAWIADGEEKSAAGLTHYREGLTGSGSKFYFRRGIGLELTSGSFARGQGILYGSWRSRGVILPAEELVFNPTNDTAGWNYFVLAGGRPQSTNGVDAGKAVVFGSGNLNNALFVLGDSLR